MNNKKILINGLLITTLIMVTSGCATKLVYNNQDPSGNHQGVNISANISYSDGKYDCTLDPIVGLVLNCQYLVLTINNLSDKDYYINWDQTYYTYNNDLNGGFYFSGVVIKQRKESKRNELVRKNSVVSKNIYPNILTTWGSYGWETDSMPLGINGIYLVLSDNEGKDKAITLNIELSK